MGSTSKLSDYRAFYRRNSANDKTEMKMVPVRLSTAELKEIDEFGLGRFPSRNAALRRLIFTGLDAERANSGRSTE